MIFWRAFGISGGEFEHPKPPRVRHCSILPKVTIIQHMFQSLYATARRTDALSTSEFTFFNLHWMSEKPSICSSGRNTTAARCLLTLCVVTTNTERCNYQMCRYPVGRQADMSNTALCCQATSWLQCRAPRARSSGPDRSTCT